MSPRQVVLAVLVVLDLAACHKKRTAEEQYDYEQTLMMQKLLNAAAERDVCEQLADGGPVAPGCEVWADRTDAGPLVDLAGEQPTTRMAPESR